MNNKNEIIKKEVKTPEMILIDEIYKRLKFNIDFDETTGYAVDELLNIITMIGNFKGSTKIVKDHYEEWKYYMHTEFKSKIEQIEFQKKCINGN